MRLNWHVQNLSDKDIVVKRPDGTRQHTTIYTRPLWMGGRAWLKLPRIEINPEWHIKLQNRAGLGVAVGGGDSDRDLQFNLSLPIGSFYLTFDSLPRALTDRILPGRWIDTNRGRLKITEEREVSLNWHDNALWWYGWYSTNTWRSRDPWWRRGSFHPDTFLLGRMDCMIEELTDWSPVAVPMPEGSYSGKARVRRWTWKRRRVNLFAPKERIAVDIEMDECLPFPGKGENSYDCGMDGLCGWSKDGTSIDAAIAHGVESALNSRARYGGSVNWRPPGVPA